LTAVCESCQQSFVSRTEEPEAAEKEIHSAFHAHKCRRLDSSQNALRVVRESTEGK
jgi:hypothetical protein